VRIKTPSLAHVSNQGWGAWEVNPSLVLTQGGSEWANLFLGQGSLSGRYGNDQLPNDTTSNNNTPGNGIGPHFYGQFDFDGAKNFSGGYAAAGQNSFLLPGANGNPNPTYFGFPYYDSITSTNPQTGTYANGTAGAPGTEHYEHPQLYNFFQPPINPKGPLADDK